jgi:hypothetical protein
VRFLQVGNSARGDKFLCEECAALGPSKYAIDDLKLDSFAYESL